MLWAVSLSTTELIPRSLTATLNVPAFEVWLTSVTRSGPSAIQSPTSGTHTVTLHLNAFRGEPAITEFDWPFTPNHRSSPRFSTLVGSGLHDVLPTLHPAHGWMTPLRVLGTRLRSVRSDSLSPRPPHSGYPRHAPQTRRLILQKA